jgi:hypothetical protein
MWIPVPFRGQLRLQLLCHCRFHCRCLLGMGIRGFLRPRRGFEMVLGKEKETEVIGLERDYILRILLFLGNFAIWISFLGCFVDRWLIDCSFHLQNGIWIVGFFDKLCFYAIHRS